MLCHDVRMCRHSVQPWSKCHSVCPFNPRLYRENEIVASCCIFNCTEFGTIKISVIQYFPFSKIFDCAFEAKPTEYDMLLQLASCHICKADIILVIIFYDVYISVLNCYFCHGYMVRLYYNTSSTGQSTPVPLGNGRSHRFRYGWRPTLFAERGGWKR